MKPADHEEALERDPKGPYALGTQAESPNDNPYPKGDWTYDEWEEGAATVFPF